MQRTDHPWYRTKIWLSEAIFDANGYPRGSWAFDKFGGRSLDKCWWITATRTHLLLILLSKFSSSCFEIVGDLTMIERLLNYLFVVNPNRATKVRLGFQHLMPLVHSNALNLDGFPPSRLKNNKIGKESHKSVRTAPIDF